MTIQVSTTVDLVYDLCPHSRYYALPIIEQASVMHVLLRKLVDLAGNGQAGIDFLEHWADFPTPPKLEGHYLTENAAWAFALERLAELPPGSPPYSLVAADCRNCIPRPPLHLSGHTYQILSGTHHPLTISALSSLGQIVCNVYLHLSVGTPLQAHSATPGAGHSEMRMDQPTRTVVVRPHGTQPADHVP